MRKKELVFISLMIFVVSLVVYAAAPIVEFGKIYVRDNSSANKIGVTAPTLSSSYNVVLPTADGTPGQVLTTNGTGQLYFSTGSGGSGSPGGANKNVQFNNSGAFGGSNLFNWDNSVNKLLLGTLTSRDDIFNSGFTGTRLQVEGTDFSTSSMQLINNQNTTQGAWIVLGKTRSGATGGDGIVSINDRLGGISIQGNDGTNLLEAARIDVYNSATPGLNDMPGTMAFLTTSDGNSSATERMRIDHNGNVGINTSAPNAILDVLGNFMLVHNNKNNNTFKVGRIGSLSYANSNFIPLTFNSASGAPGTNDAAITLGGGTGFGYAANDVIFYTAANDTTVTGTERARINRQGTLNINTNTLLSPMKLVVQGDGVSAPTHSGTTLPSGSIARFRGSTNAVLDMGSESSTGFWFKSTDATGFNSDYPIRFFGDYLSFQKGSGGSGALLVNNTTPHSQAKLIVYGPDNTGSPASSGSTQAASMISRIDTGPISGSVYDIGALVGGGFWIASTDQGALGTKYPIHTYFGNEFRLSATNQVTDRVTSSAAIQPQAGYLNQWGIDFATTPNRVALGASSSQGLPTGSGMVILHCDSNGLAALYLTYAGIVNKIGGDPFFTTGTSPAAGNISLGFDGSNYRVYSGSAASCNVYITLIKTRPST